MRIDRDEQVGLLTCSNEHHSFLLDSSDHWDDVVQDRKPRDKRCKCGGRRYEVELDYELRDDGDVRFVTVDLRCVSCDRQTTAATFEIDYGPTDTLVTQPLEPCETPWLVPKRTELTALWVPEDLQKLVHYLVDEEHALCYFAGFRERPRLMTSTAIDAEITKEQSFHLYFSTRQLEFPDKLRDCWKHLPVIHLPWPTTMVYRTGRGLLYYIEWANAWGSDTSCTSSRVRVSDDCYSVKCHTRHSVRRRQDLTCDRLSIQQ